MIKCSIDFNLKNASIFIDNRFIETKSFNDITFRKETNIEFKICNDLHLINKISIYLKLNYNAKETDTLFIIDNKDIYNLLKPNDILIKKLTKSMKKSLSNNELKLILGSTLFEMSSIQNVDLVLQEKKNMEGDGSMFNNTLSSNFNLEKKESEFDLDGDFDFDLDAPIEPVKNNNESDFSDDFDFDLDDDISLLPFNSTNDDNNVNEINNESSFDNKPNLNNKDNIEDEVIVEDNKDNIEDEVIVEDNKDNIEDETKHEKYNFISEESILEDKSVLEEPLNDNSEKCLAKNDKGSNAENPKKHDDLKAELLKEFENMEKYIDEQIDSLEKQSKNLENESSKLKLNFSDLNVDEETIIANFNKSMEIRLRLKVIKKSCKIYNNIKIQLKDELSKF